MLLGMAVFAQTTISKDERNLALNHLKSTRTALMDAVTGLSEAQLAHKPSPETWSVVECVEHLVKSENGIWQQLQGALEDESDPSGRTEMEVSDQQILSSVPKRDRKVSTIPPLEPTNQVDGAKELLSEFNSARNRHIKFLKSTNEDLRNRYYQSPYGKADVYQMLLFLSTHTERHINQINELKEASGFPES